MSTFLRLELAGSRDPARPPYFVLLNVDHIVSVHPNWPGGSTIATSDPARTAVNVKASLDELDDMLSATGGRVHVFDVLKTIERMNDARYPKARS